MSRNLGRERCYFCDGPVVHDEPTRRITRDDAGVYFPEYEGMLVAKAHCLHCEAKYLAWVRGRKDWLIGHCAHRNYKGTDQHVDLSFLSSFNDEPGETDKPVYKIGKCRVAADGTLTLLEGHDDDK